MDYEFACLHCGQHLSASPESAGTGFDCPKCGQPGVMPALNDRSRFKNTGLATRPMAIGKPAALQPERPAPIKWNRPPTPHVERVLTPKRGLARAMFQKLPVSRLTLYALIASCVIGACWLVSHYVSPFIRNSQVDLGDASAQWNLGCKYERGEGVPKDEAKAVDWYRMAALQGYPKAQWKLGEMYELGIGVQKDDVMAYVWLNLAATNGTRPTHSLERIEQGLSLEQRAQAENLTAKLLEKIHRK